MISNGVKKIAIPMVVAAGMVGMSFITTGCGGGGTTSAPVAASTTVNGVVSKGPYLFGTPVNVYQVVNGVRATTAIATGTVTDDIGSYSVVMPSSAVGPFEIVVSGQYVDEMTGGVSTTSQPTSMIVADVASAAAGQANLNPVTSIQTELTKQALLGGATDVAAAISNAGNQALTALGVSTTDSSGKAVDPAKLNMMSAADSKIAAELITASATVAKILNTANAANPATPTVTLATFAKNAATDIKAGAPLGTTATGSVNTAAIATAQAAVTTLGSSAILSNLTTGVTNQASTNGNAAPTSVTTALSSNVGPALTTAVTTQVSPAVVRGFGLEPTFTVGTVAGSVASYTLTKTPVGLKSATPVSTKDIVLKFGFTDLNNATGMAALGTVNTYNVPFNFQIKSTTGTQKVQGTIDQVLMEVDATGLVTAISIPTGAKLDYTAVTAAPAVTITGAVTNSAANSNIVTVANTPPVNNLTVDANALLSTINNKINNASVNLTTVLIAGTYAFDFSMGLPMGLNNGGTMANLFATTPYINARGITGTITLK
ncbi:MAG: hypothetical protein HQM07_00595 [Zetaproteobacteria bacterium]|nr:hypothetical protein [Zetaproteobacteria bacterium]